MTRVTLISAYGVCDGGAGASIKTQIVVWAQQEFEMCATNLKCVSQI